MSDPKNFMENSSGSRIEWVFFVALITALAFLIQGCVFQIPQRVAPDDSLSTPFVPAVQSSQDNTTATLASALQLPSPTAPCTDNLTYINDLTIPDGSAIQPGASIDKRWEVQNSGSCNWDDRYTLRLVAGDELGAGTQHALYPARSDTNAVIQISFQAPADAGEYRSAWQAYDPQGQSFGDPIYMDIMVDEP